MRWRIHREQQRPQLEDEIERHAEGIGRHGELPLRSGSEPPRPGKLSAGRQFLHQRHEKLRVRMMTSLFQGGHRALAPCDVRCSLRLTCASERLSETTRSQSLSPQTALCVAAILRVLRSSSGLQKKVFFERKDSGH